MKYIKLFENKENKIYNVPTKTPEFWIAKDKIGAGDELSFFDDDPIGYILLHYDDDGDWTWSSVYSTDPYGTRYIDKPEYMGKIEVTQDDIDEWDMRNAAKKYNL